MKTLIPILSLVLFPLFAPAQTVADSAAVVLEVNSLIKKNISLLQEQKYEEAFEVIERAKERATSAFGKKHVAVADCAYQQAYGFYSKGEYEQAELYCLEAKTIREEVLGDQDPDYARSLNLLSILLMNTGRYDEAEQFALKANAIFKKTLGSTDPTYARGLNNLSSLYTAKGDYKKAITLKQEAKNVLEKALGEEHPDYVQALVGLGDLYANISDYKQAESFLLEAKAIQEKIFGKENPRYASNLEALGRLYEETGDYEKAESNLLAAKNILENLNTENQDYADIQGALGDLYAAMRNYEKAEPFLRKANELHKKLYGEHHPDYAKSLDNMAILYANMGSNKKAERLILEAKDIFEKNFGKKSPDYAISLNNLAILYQRAGESEKAKQALLEVKEVFEAVWGKKHPYYATILENLSRLYRLANEYEEAELLSLEAKETRKELFGENHPDYLNTLHNLAALYFEKGNYEEAEQHFLEASVGWESVFGKYNENYMLMRYNLATLYVKTGRYAEAEPIYLQVGEIQKKIITAASRHLSEAELASYINLFSKRINNYYSFVQIQDNTVDKLNEEAFDNALFHKGYLLNAVAHLNNLSLSDTSARQKYAELNDYSRRLAAEYAKPLAERQGVTELEENVNTLEKELARTAADLGQAIRQIGWREVQAQLKEGEAAIEFVHYQFSRPDPTDSTMYAAIVLTAGGESPRFVPLFEEREISAFVEGREDSRADYVNKMYVSRGVKPRKAQSKSLFELNWRPLERELTNVKTIYYAPSGLLHRINFDAISIDKKRTLGDRYELVRLGSTRRLATLRPETEGAADALLFGGVQYEMDSAAILSAQNDFEFKAELASHIDQGFEQNDRSLRGEAWQYLKGTEQEVEEIARILQEGQIERDLKMGFAASEDVFSQIGRNQPSPRILHLATHGFFFPDPGTTSSSDAKETDGEPAFKVSDNPMIRSGLILAGGNHAWQGNKPISQIEDGVLTAYEISQMDLSNTELAVLSACETGLGDIRGAEGVYGLQRAFKIAGVRYLMMSLWSAPDEETKNFMVAFYQNWISEKRSIPEAYRAAQQKMRKQYPDDPYKWAGFVLIE